MPDSDRQYSLIDRLFLSVDQVIRALGNQPKTSGAPYPAKASDDVLSESERKHSAALMRINHAGEICAQALYHGQSMVARSRELSLHMQKAAVEEGDHLAWCKTRLDELNSRTSFLNPLWYTGSFCIGMVAGMVSDATSLGFLVETEKQVINHLESHMHLLPKQDTRSYQIIVEMQKDEAKHRDEAVIAGAKELPSMIKSAMAMTAKIMVKTSYWL